MKTYYSISATIIILAIGFTTYTWYDTKKFRESIQQVKEVSSEREKPIDMNSEVPLQTVDKQETSKKIELGHGIYPEYDIGEEAHKSPELSKHEDNINHPYAHKHSDTSQKVSEVNKSNVHFFDMTTDQRISKLRAWLVENHDNSAEIEEYLQLERKSIENLVSLSNGYSVLNMHIDDQIRHAELQVILYPNHGNEGHLQQLLKTKAEIESGELIPIYEFPREMWEQVARNIDPIE